jgi:hypothetical protein
MYYNLVRLHQTLKVSPAMAAGVTDRLWEMADVVEMIETFEGKRSAVLARARGLGSVCTAAIMSR